MAKADVYVRFVGSGKQYFPGVPTKDMTKEEFERLDAVQQDDVLASSIYEVVKKRSSSTETTDDNKESN